MLTAHPSCIPILLVNIIAQSGHSFGKFKSFSSLSRTDNFANLDMFGSSFGNALTPTDHTLEVVFSIVVITCGLLLFTMLIGNIQVGLLLLLLLGHCCLLSNFLCTQIAKSWLLQLLSVHLYLHPHEVWVARAVVIQ